jgi:hypothetical protein
VLVAAALLLPACSDDGGPATAEPSSGRLEADCAAAVEQILLTTQRYLDSIAATSASAPAEPDPEPPAAADPAEAEQQYTSALAGVREHVDSIGCDQAQFRRDLVSGLEGLRAGGPVATAVLAQLQVESGGARRTATVPPGGDLVRAVAAAPEDGVVQLEAGEYQLPETLVLLRGVTIRGAGRDLTTVRSSDETVVLVLTGEPVTLDALTLTRSGEQPGSVLSASPSATLAVTAARISGGRTDDAGTGGIGVLMAAGDGGQGGPARRTSLRFLDSEAVDNAVAGVVLAGEHRAEIAGSVVERSGQCGICFLSTTDGTVADSRLSANAAGLVVSGDARPVVRSLTIDGGEVGVQVLERGAPQLDGTTVRGSAQAAFLFADQGRGLVRGSTCEGTAPGIVVGPASAPELDVNDCTLVRGP